MRLYNIYGKLVNKSVNKYRIKWDGKSLSKAQFETKQFLKKYWSNHVVYEEFPVYGSLLKVDIINFTKMLAIEVNGEQHESYSKFFHGKNRMKFLTQIKNDQKKYEWLEKNNFKLLIIYDKEVKKISKEFFLQKFNVDIA